MDVSIGGESAGRLVIEVFIYLNTTFTQFCCFTLYFVGFEGTKIKLIIKYL